MPQKPPRGMKAALKRSAPVRLRAAGRSVAKPDGRKYRGLTKALEAKLWSAGTFRRAHQSVGSGGAAARVEGRGAAGDEERPWTRSSARSSTGAWPCRKGQYTLTKLVLMALAERGLSPVMAQRSVCHDASRLATAADLVCYDADASELVIVELKCGHSEIETHRQ